MIKLALIQKLSSIFKDKCVKFAQEGFDFDDDLFGGIDSDDEPEKTPVATEAPSPVNEIDFDDDLFGGLDFDDEEPSEDPIFQENVEKAQPQIEVPKPSAMSEGDKKMERELAKALGSDYKILLDQQIDQFGKSKPEALQYLYDNFLSLYSIEEDLSNGESLDQISQQDEGSSGDVITSDDFGGGSLEGEFGDQLGYEDYSIPEFSDSEISELPESDFTDTIKSTFDEAQEKGQEYFSGSRMTGSTFNKKKNDKERMMLKRKGISPGAFFNALNNRNFDDLSPEEKKEVLTIASGPNKETVNKRIEEHRKSERERDARRRSKDTEQGQTAIAIKNRRKRIADLLMKQRGISREEAREILSREVDQKVNEQAYKDGLDGEDKSLLYEAVATEYYNELKSKGKAEKAEKTKLVNQFLKLVKKSDPEADLKDMKTQLKDLSLEEVKELMKDEFGEV